MSFTIPETPSDKFVAIIASLGGPAIDPDDIKWAVNLPTGESLINWIVDQLQLDPAAEPLTAEQRQFYFQAALENIALEGEEISLFKQSSGSAVADLHSSELGTRYCATPYDYVLPSRRRSQIISMNEESSLLEEETALLKHRLRQTKLATQKTAQTIKAIQSAIETENVEIKQIQERLAELSIKADMTMDSSLISSGNIVEGLQKKGLISLNQVALPDHEESHHALTMLASLRSSVIDYHESQMLLVDEALQQIPPPVQVAEEADRLRNVFNKMQDGSTLVQAAEQAALEAELNVFCRELEATDKESDVLKLLDEDKSSDEVDLVQVNVVGELERAWSLDQGANLEFQGAVLSDTIAAFTGTILPPLRSLYDILSTNDAEIREAEALVGALGEEIEEIVDDVRMAAGFDQSPLKPSIKAINDEILEVKLTECLKALQDLRPSDAPPLVIMDRTDVLNELHYLFDQAGVLDDQEEAWSAKLSTTLSLLKSAYAPLVSTIYANSPVNLSPPFNLPQNMIALESEASQNGDELVQALAQLQKDIEMLEIGRVQRKLNAFMDKWCRKAL